MYIYKLLIVDVPLLGSTFRIQWAKLITFIRENLSQTVSTTASFTINHRYEIAYCWFAV